MPEDDVELPRGIALAWGLPSSAERRPKSDLSVERIISIAVEIADESGLSAVSMAAVAGRLGYTPMSLYRYVSAKDDLVLLMGDAAFGSAPTGIPDAPDWREAVTRWIDASLALYREHPWLLDLPADTMPLTPNAIGWMEAIITAFSSTHLSVDETVKAALLIVGQTRWEASLTRARRSAAEPTSMEADASTAADEKGLSTLVDEGALPRMAKVMRARRLFSETQGYTFGLERTLDGLASYIDSRTPLPD